MAEFCDLEQLLDFLISAFTRLTAEDVEQEDKTWSLSLIEFLLDLRKSYNNKQSNTTVHDRGG